MSSIFSFPCEEHCCRHRSGNPDCEKLSPELFYNLIAPPPARHRPPSLNDLLVRQAIVSVDAERELWPGPLAFSILQKSLYISSVAFPGRIEDHEECEQLEP